MNCARPGARLGGAQGPWLPATRLSGCTALMGVRLRALAAGGLAAGGGSPNGPVAAIAAATDPRGRTALGSEVGGMGARAHAGKTPGNVVAGRIGGAGRGSMLAEAGPPAPRPVGAGRAAITPGPEELGPRAADSMGRELLGAAGATDEFADRGVAGRLRLADVRVEVLEAVERAELELQPRRAS